MTAGFGGALAVVRVRIRPDAMFATLPQLRDEAQAYADRLRSEVTRLSVTTSFVSLDTGIGLACWVRASDVQVIDVVPTEDPSVEPPGRPA